MHYPHARHGGAARDQPSGALVQVGSCFSELVVGVDGGLRTYGLTQEPSWQAIQQQWMQRFRDFAIKAQYRTETLRYGSAPTRPEPLVCLQRVKPVRGLFRHVSHLQDMGWGLPALTWSAHGTMLAPGAELILCSTSAKIHSLIPRRGGSRP